MTELNNYEKILLLLEGKDLTAKEIAEEIKLSEDSDKNLNEINVYCNLLKKQGKLMVKRREGKAYVYGISPLTDLVSFIQFVNTNNQIDELYKEGALYGIKWTLKLLRIPELTDKIETALREFQTMYI